MSSKERVGRTLSVFSDLQHVFGEVAF